jgi:hypothetical protein
VRGLFYLSGRVLFKWKGFIYVEGFYYYIGVLFKGEGFILFKRKGFI